MKDFEKFLRQIAISVGWVERSDTQRACRK